MSEKHLTCACPSAQEQASREARLDEKVDSPDGTQGVGYARRKPPLSGYRHNCSMTGQGRPGLFMASQESQASRTGRETSGQS